jgi:hypothetical protein
MDTATIEDTSKMMCTPPSSPGPYSELPPPPPMSRTRPSGPDPYATDRVTARAAAAAGCSCPVNQHGCFYFSKSEWIFCPMCEWEVGHAQGVREIKLVYMGGTMEQEAAVVADGNTVCVSRADLNGIFTGRKTFLGLINDLIWDKVKCNGEQRAILSRTMLHNLLMKYGAPMNCLTDEVWADLQRRFPADHRDRLEAALAALGAKPYHPIYAPLKPSSE